MFRAVVDVLVEVEAVYKRLMRMLKLKDITETTSL